MSKKLKVYLIQILFILLVLGTVSYFHKLDLIWYITGIFMQTLSQDIHNHFNKE